MTVNDDSRIVNKLEASLTDDARVVIYNRHMFIVQATGLQLKNSNFWPSADVSACLLCLCACNDLYGKTGMNTNGRES